MAAGGRKLYSIAVNLDAAQYLRGWRAEGSLFLPALSEGRLGDEVAARVGILGRPIRATVFGTVTLVRRVGRLSLPPGVELALDRMSLPAAKFLAAAARGEKLPFRERAPRYVFACPLRFQGDGMKQDATTFNVSDGGCAVGWSGSLPLVGEVLTARLDEGLFAKTVRAVVCWTGAGDALQHCAGLRVAADGRAARAWKALVARAAKSGGRAA
jgi:Tfp pilus assembly protein PilZ